MDELRLVLSTKLMRGIITKIIKKAILKKTGYEIDIQLNEIVATTNDGKVSLHMDVDASVNSDDFVDIVKKSGLI